MRRIEPDSVECREHDELYLGALEEYEPALQRLARGYENDSEKRRDLIQEIQFQLWRSFAHFDGRCSLRTKTHIAETSNDRLKTNLSDSTFDEPRLALNRIYTRTGDKGETHLAGGQRIAKDDPRIECYGTVDELNAFVGLARTTAETSPALDSLATILKRVQHELFNLGSILATLPEDVHPKQARITGAEVARLECEIDSANESLPPLRSFVLPGASRLDAELHMARTICRRAERQLVHLARETSVPEEAVRYLNRLSDALFVWSRWVNHVQGIPETLWQPNAASSGQTRE